jgi:hypothetical protein
VRDGRMEGERVERTTHQSFSTLPLAVHVDEHCDLSNFAQLLTFAFE